MGGDAQALRARQRVGVRGRVPGPGHALGGRAHRRAVVLGGLGPLRGARRPQRLLHGGFGLLTVGNLRKPRFWALALLERLGEHEIGAEVSGDGAGSLVEAWAAREDDGRVTVAVWNGTLDQSKVAGDPLLDRRATGLVDGLPAGAYELRHLRMDLGHSNIAAVWEKMRGDADWPDEAAWRTLRGADRLEALRPPARVTPAGGVLETTFELPLPSMSLLELVPR
ncbi:MAG TPA: hypothetical protein VFA45_00415 [Actinomycetes bacterium]|nr:hypothetical protein [Actinomycetes bacterium]